MIALGELLGKYKMEDQPSETQANLKVLLDRVNKIRLPWGRVMIVTSGLRSMSDHLEIYRSRGVPEDKIPMHSHHLYGAAVDIYDPKLELTAWLKANPSWLEIAQLWCEAGNDSWVHFQVVAPKSGNRWFTP